MQKTMGSLIWLIITLMIVNVNCIRENPEAEYAAQIEKLVSFWNTGKFEGIENVLHEEFEIRMSPHYEPEMGIAAFKESVIKTREAYPDFFISIVEGLYSKEAVAGRWTIQATSKNGKKLNIMGMSILHFVDGKIKDEWISNNDLQWLEQLGYQINPPAKTEK